MLLVRAIDSCFAQRHQHLPVRAELEDLMSHAFLEPLCTSGVTCGRTLRDPHVSFAVDEEAVWKRNEAFAETLDQVSFHIEHQDRIQVGARATVRATSIEDPEMLAIRIHPYAARDSDFSSLEFVPVVIRAIWIERYLGRQLCNRHHCQRRETRSERRGDSR